MVVPIVMEDVRQVDFKTSSNELYHILGKLVALYRNLVDLLHEEYADMAAVDLNGIAEAAHAKETILSEILNLEQLRLKSSEKTATALGLSAPNATLLKIAERLPASEGDKLRAIRSALNLLVAQSKELNVKNMSFAQNSLERIEEMKKNALGLNSAVTRENYSSSGVRQPIAEQGGRLLSTEA